MTNRHIWKSFCAAAVVLLAAASARADAVLDWNAIMQAAVSTQPPFPQARLAAITQLAVFEAVNAITHDYQPYLGTITAPTNASAAAAAIAAAHAALKNYFPADGPSLDAAFVSSLAAIPDSPEKAAGIAVGAAAAAAMIAARANDGSTPSAFSLPASSNPGVWQLTPSCTAAGGAFFQWQHVTPFGIRSLSQFRLDPPPPLTSDRYMRSFNEMKEVGGINSADRAPDRATVALFYSAITPVGVFNPAARQISMVQGKTLSENAHDLALINMAISDGAVATFDNKYHFNFWRPETAIHEATADGNSKTAPDPSFQPFIVTPCFPGYPSAHATLTNAAREVAEYAYGFGPFFITLVNGATTLHYTAFSQISDDVDDARVYGGIHFRTDQDGGRELGRRVGEYIYQHNLRRTHDDSVDR